jgi:hypothetical protein
VLVALDVCGFSRDPRLDKLLDHRLKFFTAVNRAPNRVLQLVKNGRIKVQFLGDELRFAFGTGIPECARMARDFIDVIFDDLAKSSPGTRLRGLVREGNLSWDEYRRCIFFVGTPANECALQLSGAEENQVLCDERFREALGSEAMQSDLREKVWPPDHPLKDFKAYILYPR